MNWVDIVILVVWAATALWGASVGLLRIAIHLVIVAAGLALSSRIAEPVGALFAPLTDNEVAQTVAGFITIFAILFIAGGVVSFWARMILGIVPLFGMVNKLGGLVVGVVLGFLLLSGVLTGIQRFPVAGLDKTIGDSALGAFLADNFDVVIRGVGLIPGDWDDEVKKLAE